MFLIILAILVTIGAGYMLVKGKQPIMVLLLAGLLLIGAAVILDSSAMPLSEDATSGSRWVDIFGVIESVAKNQLAGVGLIIMAAGGFSSYMKKIGATRALVEVAASPMERFHRPYVLLVIAYFLGQSLFMVIPSAAGLALLLLVTLLPILKSAGVRPAAAGAVIASVSALPMGPGTGTAILAAETVGVSPAVYFVKNQLPVAIPTMIAIAVTIYFTQKYIDRREAASAIQVEQEQAAGASAPKWYALLVICPIILLIVFSPLTNDAIELSTVSAFFVVWLAAMVIELIRRREINGVFLDARQFFAGMGNIFTSVVALIIAAQVFAEGLKITGLIDGLIGLAQRGEIGIGVMAIILTLIVGLVTFLTGSGVGAFSAFASLAPKVASDMGGSVATLVTPMQFAGGLFRSMSPISGVVISVAGTVGVSPAAIVKRTALPMAVGIVVMTTLSLIVG